MTVSEKADLKRAKHRVNKDSRYADIAYRYREHPNARVKCDRCGHVFHAHTVDFFSKSEQLKYTDICKYALCSCKGYIHPDSELARTRDKVTLISAKEAEKLGLSRPRGAGKNALLNNKQADEMFDKLDKVFQFDKVALKEEYQIPDLPQEEEDEMLEADKDQDV